MSKQHDNTPSRNEFHQRFSNAPWGAFAIAGAILVVGGAFVFSLPEDSHNAAPAPAVASAEASAATETDGRATGATSDETLCDRQTWPYIDQRCAQRVNAARDTRKVRIVTDKGNSVTAVTAVPTVEPKPADKPKPMPQPAVAHNDSHAIGPAAAPSAPADEAAPQGQQAAAAPQPTQNPPPARTQSAGADRQQQQPAPAPQSNPR